MTTHPETMEEKIKILKDTPPYMNKTARMYKKLKISEKDIVLNMTLHLKQVWWEFIKDLPGDFHHKGGS